MLPPSAHAERRWEGDRRCRQKSTFGRWSHPTRQCGMCELRVQSHCWERLFPMHWPAQTWDCASFKTKFHPEHRNPQALLLSAAKGMWKEHQECLGIIGHESVEVTSEMKQKVSLCEMLVIIITGPEIEKTRRTWCIDRWGPCCRCTLRRHTFGYQWYSTRMPLRNDS